MISASLLIVVIRLDVFLLIFRKHLKKFDTIVSDFLKQNGISGKLRKLLHEVLVNRKQSAVLNGQVSS